MLGQYLGRKSILTRGQKRVKEASKNRSIRSSRQHAVDETRDKPYVDSSHPTCGARLAGLRSRQVHSFWRQIMPGPIVCSQCDKTEHDCTCEKYCTICKGQ